MKKIMILFFALTIATACTTTQKVTFTQKVALIATEGVGQKTIYQDGNQVILSKGRNTVFLTIPKEDGFKHSTGNLVIAVKNETSNEFVFSTENISASATLNQEKNVALSVLNYDDMISQKKRRHNAKVFAAALSGSLGSYSNSYNNEVTNYMARRDSRLETKENIGNINQQTSNDLNDLEKNFLKKQTVVPGMLYGGNVQINLPKKVKTVNHIQIVVNVDNESHRFILKQERKNR